MSIALFALAAVMIVGGIVSVIQGFPFVRLESGLAMTIAGATTASAGAVVLGLAVLARRLRGLEQALTAGRPALRAADLPEAEAEPAGSMRQRPSLAATAASLGGLTAAGLGGAAATRSGREPSFFDPAPPPPAPSSAEPLLPNLLPDAPAPEPHPEGDDARERAREEAMLFAEPAPQAPQPVPPVFVEPEAHPEPALHPEPEPEPAPPPHIEPHVDAAPLAEPTASLEPERPAEPEPHAPLESHAGQESHAPLEPHAGQEPEPVALRSSLVEPEEHREHPAAEPEPAPQPVEEATIAEAEPQVVGTYASGGNTYVMYSTGVIEAETPRGRFTFASLDELKAFVEAGGETDARGAA